MPANASPFLVLWYLYLGFFGVVLIIHVLCRLFSGLVGWRVNVLMRTRMQKKVHIHVQAQED